MRLFRVMFCAFLVLVLADSAMAGGGETDAIRAQWHVVAEKGDDWPSYWLANKKYPQLRQEMFLAGPIADDRPWIDDVVEVDREKGIYLITYYAGQPGTSELVDVYYALIYDAGKKAILGQYPYSCKSSRNDYSPKWTFEDNRILIRDEDADPVVVNY